MKIAQVIMFLSLNAFSMPSSSSLEGSDDSVVFTHCVSEKSRVGAGSRPACYKTPRAEKLAMKDCYDSGFKTCEFLKSTCTRIKSFHQVCVSVTGR